MYNINHVITNKKKIFCYPKLCSPDLKFDMFNIHIYVVYEICLMLFILRFCSLLQHLNFTHEYYFTVTLKNDMQVYRERIELLSVSNLIFFCYIMFTWKFVPVWRYWYSSIFFICIITNIIQSVTISALNKYTLIIYSYKNCMHVYI